VVAKVLQDIILPKKIIPNSYYHSPKLLASVTKKAAYYKTALQKVRFSG